MQEVDFMLLEQAFTRQGKEPNPGRARGEGTLVAPSPVPGM